MLTTVEIISNFEVFSDLFKAAYSSLITVTSIQAIAIAFSVVMERKLKKIKNLLKKVQLTAEHLQ